MSMLAREVSRLIGAVEISNLEDIDGAPMMRCAVLLVATGDSVPIFELLEPQELVVVSGAVVAVVG